MFFQNVTHSLSNCFKLVYEVAYKPYRNLTHAAHVTKSVCRNNSNNDNSINDRQMHSENEENEEFCESNASIFPLRHCILATLRWVFRIRLCMFGGSLPPIRCNGSANCAAVACSLNSAALVSFQRHPPEQPPCQNVNSAPRSLASAMHFGGKSSQIAVGVISAITTLFRLRLCIKSRRLET